MKKILSLLLLTACLCFSHAFAQKVVNPNFSNGKNGWTVSGSDLKVLSGVMRSSNVYAFDAHQQFTNVPQGLYRLRVQSFQFVGTEENAWGLYGRRAVTTTMYMNDAETAVKNIFDEALPTCSYKNYVASGEMTFVPFSAETAAQAFNAGRYDNELYVYTADGNLTIGVKGPQMEDIHQWTCFDNFRLDYISESSLQQLADTLTLLCNQPCHQDFKTLAGSLLSQLNAARDYASKSAVLVTGQLSLCDAMLSVSDYAALKDSVASLRTRLSAATTVSSTTKAEAQTLIADITASLSKGTLTHRDCTLQGMALAEMTRRIAYRHVEVSAVSAGGLGDAILAKESNLANVHSLTVTGTLDDADIKVIQSRLTSLHELNLAGAKMSVLPASMFYQNKNIERVVLPQTLTTIGEKAFYECTMLKSITFGPALTSIGEYAFYDCLCLRDVVLPEGFTSLGEEAFRWCLSLSKVVLPSTLTVIMPHTFRDCGLREVSFSKGLNSIGHHAFAASTGTNTLADGTPVRRYANTLERITLPEGLTEIWEGILSGCTGLTEVTLPSTLILAKDSPLRDCSALRKITCLAIDPPYLNTKPLNGISLEGRELCVPALSVNSYKLNDWWSMFTTVTPIDVLPENICAHGDLRLTIPTMLLTTYKPVVRLWHGKKGGNYQDYGSLTTEGSGLLQMASFTMVWDPNYELAYSNLNRHYCPLVANARMRADEVSVNAYFRNNRWAFVTFPFDVKVGDITATLSGSTDWVVRAYDGEKRARGETKTTWVRLQAADIMEAGKGYILSSNRKSNDYTDYSGLRFKAMDNASKNNIFTTADAVVTLSTHTSELPHNRGWNLIGNPYPCYYDIRFMHFDAPITTWDIDDRTYVAYSPLDDAVVLSPGQAFFVQCPQGSGSITFSKEGRQTNRTARTLDTARQQTPGTPQRTVINLTINDGSHSDRTRLVINDKASMDYELNRDAAKFLSSDATVPQLYTTDGLADYAINERPLAGATAALTIRTGSDGTYTIALTNNVTDFDIILEDRQENCYTRLTADEHYTFTAKAGTTASRFVLHLGNVSTGINVATTAEETDAPVYTIGGTMIRKPQQKGIYIQNGKKITVQ